MAQRGKDIDTLTTKGPSRPAEQPRLPGAADIKGDKGDGRHEVDAPGERADDEAAPGQKHVTRQD